MLHKDFLTEFLEEADYIKIEHEIYKKALEHYNNEFTIRFDDYYKSAYGFSEFPTFTQYFSMVHEPKLYEK